MEWEIFCIWSSYVPPDELTHGAHENQGNACIVNSFTTNPMELNINRTDYSALEIIEMVFRQFDKTMEPDFGDYDWALQMIRHEVEQTGRLQN